jgi:hypothetical protein
MLPTCGFQYIFKLFLPRPSPYGETCESLDLDFNQSRLAKLVKQVFFFQKGYK